MHRRPTFKKCWRSKPHQTRAIARADLESMGSDSFRELNRKHLYVQPMIRLKHDHDWQFGQDKKTLEQLCAAPL
jgi:hypothetical protein